MLAAAGLAMIWRQLARPIPRVSMAGPGRAPDALVAGLGGQGLLAPDGSLWLWGYDGAGFTGTNDPCLRLPVRIGTITDWRQVAVDSGRVLGIRQNGSLWGWAGSRTSRPAAPSEPAPQLPGTDWIQVAAGFGRALALKANGSLFGFGSNPFGQIGDGTETDRSQWVPVTPGFRWREVAVASETTAAIAADGSLWHWGHGVGRSPVRLDATHQWSQLTSCGTAFLAREAGGLWAVWGENIHLLVGDTPPIEGTPLHPVPESSRWERLWVLGTGMLAQEASGFLWSWGDALLDPRRNLTVADPLKRRPIAVPVGVQVIGPEAFHGNVLGWSADGTLWTWGGLLGGDCPPEPGDDWRATAANVVRRRGFDPKWLRRWAGIQEPFSPRFEPRVRFVLP